MLDSKKDMALRVFIRLVRRACETRDIDLTLVEDGPCKFRHFRTERLWRAFWLGIAFSEEFEEREQHDA